MHNNLNYIMTFALTKNMADWPPNRPWADSTLKRRLPGRL